MMVIKCQKIPSWKIMSILSVTTVHYTFKVKQRCSAQSWVFWRIYASWDSHPLLIREKKTFPGTQSNSVIKEMSIVILVKLVKSWEISNFTTFKVNLNLYLSPQIVPSGTVSLKCWTFFSLEFTHESEQGESPEIIPSQL